MIRILRLPAKDRANDEKTRSYDVTFLGRAVGGTLGCGGVWATYTPTALAAKKGTLVRDIVQRGLAILRTTMVNSRCIYMTSTWSLRASFLTAPYGRLLMNFKGQAADAKMNMTSLVP